MEYKEEISNSTNHKLVCPKCGYPLPDYALIVAKVAQAALKDGNKMGDLYIVNDQCTNCGEKYEASITIKSS